MANAAQNRLPGQVNDQPVDLESPRLWNKASISAAGNAIGKMPILEAVIKENISKQLARRIAQGSRSEQSPGGMFARAAGRRNSPRGQNSAPS